MSETEAPPATRRDDVENEPLLADARGEPGPDHTKPEGRKGDRVEEFAAIVSAELFSQFYVDAHNDFSDCSAGLSTYSVLTAHTQPD